MNYREVAMQWTGPEYDMETRTKVNALLHGDEKELEDAFYRTLEFGTGGLRGIMGVGTTAASLPRLRPKSLPTTDSRFISSTT